MYSARQLELREEQRQSRARERSGIDAFEQIEIRKFEKESRELSRTTQLNDLKAKAEGSTNNLKAATESSSLFSSAPRTSTFNTNSSSVQSAMPATQFQLPSLENQYQASSRGNSGFGMRIKNSRTTQQRMNLQTTQDEQVNEQDTASNNTGLSRLARR